MRISRIVRIEKIVITYPHDSQNPHTFFSFIVSFVIFVVKHDLVFLRHCVRASVSSVRYNVLY